MTTVAIAPGSNLSRGWRLVAMLIVAAIFIEAVFAGAMLSGASWGRPAHALTAVVVFAAALISGLVALVTLRRVPHGLALGLILVGLAAGVLVQAVLGAMTAKGANLAWLHVP